MAARIAKTADATDGKKTGTGEWVGLFIPLPRGLAKQFPPEGRQVADDNTPAHATFFYVGKMDPARSAEFVQIARDTLKEIGPVKATLGDIGYFDNDDYRVAYSKVSFNKDLARFRRVFRDRLTEAKIKFSERSPDKYKAHCTLAYLPAGSGENWSGPKPTGSWDINTIEIWGLPTAHRLKVAATYDPESWYYDLESSAPLQLVIDRWQVQRPGQDKRGSPMPRQKVYDRSMPAFFSARDLWPHREYTWTRASARADAVMLKGKRVMLEGPDKWDVLVESMKQRGWDASDPLHFYIGTDGGSKVGEGNHRLAIAREIGLNKIPVWFHFQGGRVTKSKKPDPPTEVTPRAVKKVIERKQDPRKKRSPEEEKRIDEMVDRLMKLL